MIYVHLTEAALRGAAGVTGEGPGIEPDTGRTGIDLAHLDTAGAPRGPITADQVRDWCATPGTRVTIKPVIDLNRHESVDAYAAPERIADHVRLKWPTCVFPYCGRPARTSDLDHRHPYAPGIPGQTSTDGLYPLCRRHHRIKTHPTLGTTGPPDNRRWRYRPTQSHRGEPPGALHWTSPHDQHFIVDHHGTTPWPPPERHRPADPD